MPPKVKVARKKSVGKAKKKKATKATMHIGPHHAATQKVTTNIHLHDSKPKRKRKHVKKVGSASTVTSGGVTVTTSRGYVINNRPSLPYIAPAATSIPEPGIPMGPHQPIHHDFVNPKIPHSTVTNNPVFDHPYHYDVTPRGPHVHVHPSSESAGRKFEELMAKLPKLRVGTPRTHTPHSAGVQVTPQTSERSRRKIDEANARADVLRSAVENLTNDEIRRRSMAAERSRLYRLRRKGMKKHT